jgi:hypothetical protein
MNKVVFYTVILIVILNALDLFSTVLCMRTGLCYESNPVAILLWDNIGFFNTAVLKMSLPFLVYALYELLLWQAKKRCTSRGFLFAKIVVASLLLFDSIILFYAVLGNFSILFKIGGSIL